MYEVWHKAEGTEVFLASFVEQDDAQMFLRCTTEADSNPHGVYVIRETKEKDAAPEHPAKPPVEEAPFLRVKVTETSCARAFAGGHVLLSERSENDGAEKYAIVIEGRELTLTRAEVVVFRRMVEETFPWQAE